MVECIDVELQVGEEPLTFSPQDSLDRGKTASNDPHG
jgi:hypothetical protein